jgi:hypothetical protein
VLQCDTTPAATRPCSSTGRRRSAWPRGRCETLGFSDNANLEDGARWPTSFALKKLTGTEEKKIVTLVKKAVRSAR